MQNDISIWLTFQCTFEPISGRSGGMTGGCFDQCSSVGLKKGRGTLGRGWHTERARGGSLVYNKRKREWTRKRDRRSNRGTRALENKSKGNTIDLQQDEVTTYFCSLLSINIDRADRRVCAPQWGRPPREAVNLVQTDLKSCHPLYLTKPLDFFQRLLYNSFSVWCFCFGIAVHLSYFFGKRRIIHASGLIFRSVISVQEFSCLATIIITSAVHSILVQYLNNLASH